VSATQVLAPGGADIKTRAVLMSAGGTEIHIASNMDAPARAEITFTGSKGHLRVNNPLAPHMGHKFTLTVDDAETSETFPTRATYAYQLEVFRDAVAGGADVPTRGDDSLAHVQLLAAIRDAATKE
jgi:hypothetical protein